VPHIYLSAVPSLDITSKALSANLTHLPVFTTSDIMQLQGEDPVLQRYITCVAVSADGTRIVSGSQGNTIYVWDTQTSKLAV